MKLFVERCTGAFRAGAPKLLVEKRPGGRLALHLDYDNKDMYVGVWCGVVYAYIHPYLYMYIYV